MIIDEAIKAAKQALRKGDRKTARQIAHQVIVKDPTNKDAWLILAALSPPDTAVKYLQRVLEIDPQNLTAKKGLAWYSAQNIQPSPSTPISSRQQPFQVKRKQIILPWFLVLLGIITVGLTLLQNIPSLAFPAIQPAATLILHENPLIDRASLTPTPTHTATSTPSPTQTATPAPTITFTLTATQSAPTPTSPTKAASKSATKKKNQQSNHSTNNNKPKNNFPPISPPKGIDKNEHWIEVDLSAQRSYAYIGTSRVKSFLVSTGTWLHPTVTGVFKVYVKYRYANMSGPGYFLPDVPYVMYFYHDYGLHGTYWHHNFGVPMSHGCVNYSIPDAAWLFDFTNIGTIVYIHP